MEVIGRNTEHKSLEDVPPSSSHLHSQLDQMQETVLMAFPGVRKQVKRAIMATSAL